MYTLTLQLYAAGNWLDAMTLVFAEPLKGFEGACRFAYKQDYIAGHFDFIQSPFSRAVSARLPLDWDNVSLKKAPAFLHDIAPAGAAKRFLMARMGQEKPDEVSADLFLLGRSTPAPIGNMRIKESVEALDSRPPMGFRREEVIARDNTFLEYAYEQGAAIGGATGAGGEAPKLLMTENREGLLYPDAVLDDGEAVRHWFVKFARNKAGQTDQDILRSEYHYYKALQTLGIETIAADGLALEEASKPSLWMPRFDRKVTEQGVERLAVESIYSLAGVTIPGSYMKHLEVIQLLATLWKQAGQADQVPDLVADYLRRDLLNKILGNSDNHGRNTSIIRDMDSFRLAPIYDLAPMVMDEEDVTRTTKWSKELEVAGEIDWRGVCHALADIADPQGVFERLRQDAEHLLALPDILAGSGLPDVTMNHPSIALKNLEQRLKNWGLK
ncbi:type II toxin-antitoxin system HipA family toxin [Pseudomonas brassicacearum]|uniref:Toxin HipA n=1 Tax=Pseudomonas brassicacearum TaxID=930166 RepID=A0A423GLP4_9PSED|nr:HipA domain-containing protein [Pseudomonas brassicacearum]ROM92146.1 toxin HipA [Pseudomonas brassicacearum]